MNKPVNRGKYYAPRKTSKRRTISDYYIPPFVPVVGIVLLVIILIIAIKSCKNDNNAENDPVIEPTVVSQTETTTAPTEPEVPVFAFDADSHGIYAGDTRQAIVENAPDEELSWSSSNEKIVAVDDTGLMTGVKAGEAVITVSTGSGLTAELNVTVVKKTPDPALDLPENYSPVLKVVNNDNPVTKDYVPKLVKVRSEILTAYPKNTNLTAECEEALAKMYADFTAQDLGTLRLISTYRSYEKQDELLKESIKKRKKQGMSEKEARADALKTRQAPGCSEHQLGVSIDFSTGYNTDRGFYKTKQGKWLTANAWKYGFVLRYPADKEEITKISYEPWHFRYVGTQHSKYIYDHSLCVEEYVKLQKQAAKSAEEYAAANPLD